ncbi:MAG TPA: alkene reductase [Gammaproteobacteria bacterium]|nr:alkene reductase [Gammaproteobacteria bacterium]
MSEPDLFSPVKLGNLTLNNRMVMAPMTRNRAGEGNVPQAINVEYYRQRATAGLIITEAAQVSPEGVGYPGTPGIHSEEQVAGWKKVTDAVHKEGGRIFIQLWFCGRISHPDLLPGNKLPVAPSAIKPEGEVMTFEGMKPYVEPHALEVEEILAIVEQYRHAAAMAKQAGFDGVEIHAANGYLLDQFLRDGSNQREDEYGGSVQNRMRFLNQVIDAVYESWNRQNVGVRLSPENRFNSMSDSDPQQHFSYFISQLNAHAPVYIHLLEGDMISGERNVNYPALRDAFDGLYIANNGYDKERAEKVLAEGNADLVAFGVPFLANPDLVYRYQHDLPLNEPDMSTFYGGDEKGYTDYPFAER